MLRFSFNLRTTLILSGILLGLNLLPFHLTTTDMKPHPWEKYDVELLTKLKTTNDIIAYTDSVSAQLGIRQGTVEYGIQLDNVVKSRFSHGYSYYALNENWIASVSGLVWNDLAAIVIPNDILKYPIAACSQQCIVLMDCFRKKNIPYRTIYFSSHYAVEARFDNNWFYFDPDMEPNLTNETITNMDRLAKSEYLYSAYKSVSDSIMISKTLTSFKYGRNNAASAPRATIFHVITKFLSKTFWLLPLLIFGFVSFYRRKKLSPATELNTIF
jgi:hypothetical protein